MNEPTCSVCGKSGPLKRGMCRADYAAWRKKLAKAGQPLPPRPKSKSVYPCRVEGCGEPAGYKRLCPKHRNRKNRTGDPLAPNRRLVKRDVEARFWGKVDKSGPVPAHCPELGQCWNWILSTNKTGYGTFFWNGRKMLAHRFAYAYFVAEIPDGLEVRHRCDNPPCVNPAHLIPGTHLDNMQDMVERDRQWRKEWKVCDQGHDLTLPGAILHQKQADRCRECTKEYSRQKRSRERGGPPRKLKLDDRQVAEIRIKRASGVKLRVLAAEYGASEAYICDITKGRVRKQQAA